MGMHFLIYQNIFYLDSNREPPMYLIRVLPTRPPNYMMLFKPDKNASTVKNSLFMREREEEAVRRDQLAMCVAGCFLRDGRTKGEGRERVCNLFLSL